MLCAAAACCSVSFPVLPHRAERPRPRRLLRFFSGKPLHGTDRGTGLPYNTPTSAWVLKAGAHVSPS